MNKVWDELIHLVLVTPLFNHNIFDFRVLYRFSMFLSTAGYFSTHLTNSPHKVFSHYVIQLSCHLFPHYYNFYFEFIHKYVISVAVPIPHIIYQSFTRQTCNNVKEHYLECGSGVSGGGSSLMEEGRGTENQTVEGDGSGHPLPVVQVVRGDTTPAPLAGCWCLLFLFFISLHNIYSAVTTHTQTIIMHCSSSLKETCLQFVYSS